MIEFEVRHEAEGLRSLYRAYWQRRYGLLYRLGCLGVTLLLVWMLGMPHYPSFLPVLLAIVALLVVLMHVARENMTRLVLESLKLFDPPVIRFRLSELGVTERSTLGRFEPYWCAFAGWLELDGHLLLLRKPLETDQFIAFPLDQLPEAGRAMIEDKLDPVR